MTVMNFKAAFILLAMGFASALGASAAEPKLKTVKGTYQYYVPRHISVEKAEQIALERAIIDALAREYGTVVTQNSNLTTHSNKDGESVDFYSSATSLVKGEWVETIGTPQFDLALLNGDIVVTCNVEGKAREVIRPQADLDVKILRNHTSNDAESSVFISGDKCFLRFASPLDGFLSVYLEDEAKNVFRMLPFFSQKNSGQKVEANRPYIFFVSEEGDSEQYYLTTDKETERNVIYIVFSPNEYVQPIAQEGQGDLSLRELTTPAFRKWIDKTRALDPALQVISRPITITRPQ